MNPFESEAFSHTRLTAAVNAIPDRPRHWSLCQYPRAVARRMAKARKARAQQEKVRADRRRAQQDTMVDWGRGPR